MKKRFEVKSYYDNKLKGLEDCESFNNFSNAKDWLWEKSQKGFIVTLIDWKNGIKYCWTDIEDDEDIVIENLTDNDYEIKDQVLTDRILEHNGWKLDSSNAWDAWEEYLDDVGSKHAADSLAQCLSFDELADALVFIFNQEQYESSYLENKDDED